MVTNDDNVVHRDFRKLVNYYFVGMVDYNLVINREVIDHFDKHFVDVDHFDDGKDVDIIIEDMVDKDKEIILMNLVLLVLLDFL